MSGNGGFTSSYNTNSEYIFVMLRREVVDQMSDYLKSQDKVPTIDIWSDIIQEWLTAASAIQKAQEDKP